MSKAVNEKWKKTFPDTIGNQNRPATGVDDTQPFETGTFPQYMANDPVRYDLQNAAMSQSMSNDARLKEMVDARGKELDDHKVDPDAHKTGIAGNAATATKVVANAAAGESANIAEATMAGSDSARIRVSGDDNAGELALETADNGDEAIVARQYTGDFKDVARTASILDANGNTSFPGTVVAPKFTGALNGNAATTTKLASPRTISLSGKAAGSTSFDGSTNASINVTSVNADTASKLSTARKINITGNATGAATFDGSSDISINTTVNESKHAGAADKATADKNGADITETYLKKAGDTATGAMTFNGSLSIIKDVDEQWSIPLTVQNPSLTEGHGVYFSLGKEDSPYNRFSFGFKYTGNHAASNALNISANNGATYKFDCEGNANFPGVLTAPTFSGSLKGNADTATKLQTPRTISLTGNVAGAASFDGSKDISITTTISQAANADTLDGYHATDIFNESMRVGVVLPFSGKTIPDGYLPCNGAAVSRTTYKALFGAIGTTYGAGDGSATFNVPNLIDKFIEGSTTAGTVKAAGLPNITGQIIIDDQATVIATGAMGKITRSNKANYDADSTDNAKRANILNFDASLSNKIYGAADTVQPPAVTMQYIIKY